MVIVIIAGGSGTRLWPLSQGDHPKHLLSLTNDRSMIQNTYRRAKNVTDDIFVATEISHSQEVRKQLPDIPEDHVVVEPGRRGTASCIVLALARIASMYPRTETVAFMHADHHINDDQGFANAVRAAAESAAQQNKLALVGIQPSYPTTGLGYIEAGAEVDQKYGLPIYKVKGFKEKPDFATAKKYLAAGNFLWNQGLFAAPIATWEEQFKKHNFYYYEAYQTLKGLADDLPALSKSYLELESEAIDYALSEKTPDLIVVPGRYEWVDIGSYVDLHKILKEGEHDNFLKGNVHMINCEDSMIHATDKPVIAIGLSGIVVVDTPDGLLVCAKEQSQLVGDLSKKLQADKK